MKQKELFDKVDKILWEDWDPIGINDDGCEDEYRGYVPSIVKLLREGANEKKIAKKLYEHANINMGVTSKIEDHGGVAKKLKALFTN